MLVHRVGVGSCFRVFHGILPFNIMSLSCILILSWIDCKYKCNIDKFTFSCRNN